MVNELDVPMETGFFFKILNFLGFLFFGIKSSPSPGRQTRRKTINDWTICLNFLFGNKLLKIVSHLRRRHRHHHWTHNCKQCCNAIESV